MAKVAVIGAGPVGQVVAAVLASAGETVVVCEISEEIRGSLERTGIRLQGERNLTVGPDRFLALLPSVDQLERHSVDIVFLCVKATAIPLVASVLAEVLPPTTTVVSWQNGIDTEREISKQVPATQIVRAVVNYGVSGGPPAEAVVVSFEHPPHQVQEMVPEGRERATAVSAILSVAGLATQRAENLQAMVWKKAILNAALNGLCGMTGLNMAEATRDPYAWALAEQVLKESITVARSNEIWLGSGFFDWAREYMRTAGPHRPSMLLDLDAGRRTEIDYINGKIVEYGKRAGVTTPYNETMVAMVKARERALHR